MILILRFDEPGPYKPWSHGYDLGHLMISWLWSRKNRDLKFLDHQIPWSHDYDPANSMILRIFDFWLWALNCGDLSFFNRIHSCSKNDHKSCLQALDQNLWSFSVFLNPLCFKESSYCGKQTRCTQKPYFSFPRSSKSPTPASAEGATQFQISIEIFFQQW